MNISYSIKKWIKRRRYLFSKRSASFPMITKAELCDVMVGHPYIHEDEIKLFAKMAAATKGPIVEIGCAYGASSSIFLLHSAGGVKLVSIDPFVIDSMSTFSASEKKCRGNVGWILRALRKSDKYRDWTVIPDYSFNVAPKWKGPIEVLFIDGDHTYDAVKKDFEDWYPLVNKGGTIMIHDSRKEKGSPEGKFNRGWPGPTKLADELRNSSKVKLVNEVFSVTVWKKALP